MASIKTQFMVGSFVLIGLAVAIAMITWLGMSHYFEEGDLYVTYFDESVQGLDKDSPVKYRGVPVGRVDSIGVAPDSTLIEVVMKIEKGLELEDYTEDITAQLKSVGITGIMFIGLDRMRRFDPERSPAIAFVPEYPIIASTPSDIKKYMEGLEDVLDQLSSMDVKGISSRVKSALDSINQTVADAQVSAISSDIRSSLSRLEGILGSPRWHNILTSIEEAGTSFEALGKNANETAVQISQTVAKLDRVVANNEAGIADAIRDFKHAMGTADAFMEDGSDLVRHANSAFSTLLDHLLITQQNIESASENLNRFIETIADQPSQLILGDPPPGRKIREGMD